MSVYNQKLAACNHFKICTLIVQSCLLSKRVIIIWSSFKQFQNLYANCEMIGKSCLLFKIFKGAYSNNFKWSLSTDPCSKLGTLVAKQLATFFSLFGIKNAVHRCTYQLHKISLDLATALAIMLWQFDWIGTLGQKLILLFCVIISTTGPVVAPCPDWARGQNVS